MQHVKDLLAVSPMTDSDVAVAIGTRFQEAFENFLAATGLSRDEACRIAGRSHATLQRWMANGRIDMLAVEKLDLFFGAAGMPGFKTAVLYGPPPAVQWSAEPLPVEVIEEGVFGDPRAVALLKAWRSGGNLIDLMFKLQLQAETTLFHVDADRVALLRVGDRLPVDIALLNRDAGERRDRAYGTMMRGQIKRTAEDGITLFHNCCRWGSALPGEVSEDHYWRLGVARDGLALMFPFRRQLSPRYWID